LNEGDIVYSFSDALADMIFQKNILNHNGIDLSSFINRRMDITEKIEGPSKDLKK